MPLSRSFDDGFNNKVLCLSGENQRKGNKTPYEYFQSTGADWEEFTKWVSAFKGLGSRRMANLLNTTFAEDEQDFKERNSNDNSHIAKFVRKYCQDGLDFSRSKIDIKDRVQVRSGGITSILRKRWGLVKDREANDRHHIQDAIVIACSTQGMVTNLSRIESIFDDKVAIIKKYGRAWYDSFKERFKTPAPWTNFREDVINAVNKPDLLVSRSPRKKASGEWHGATIYTKNEKHKNYDKSKIKSGVQVRGGIASNGDMLRVDIFEKKNKKGKSEYYMVPIYLMDVEKGILPNKAKPNNEVMEEKEFKFSLYLDDYVKVTKGKETIEGYYGGADVDSARIKIITHDRHKVTEDTIDKKGNPKEGYRYYRESIKTQDSIQKFQIDILGKKLNEVVSEKRLDFSLKKK